MMAKVMHFFGNTKLFCHFLLANIEKVLYIYMPFYDGMGIYIIRCAEHIRTYFPPFQDRNQVVFQLDGEVYSLKKRLRTTRRRSCLNQRNHLKFKF
ncbi:hypothetical protein DW064_10260 [Segatella copri]|uniref:Uncharacterized protein n=1 Tax=Segatella copri TaxID=165179 RepID=A0AA92WLE9_9BACT|nr:hypothetical protein DW064_10260 [Segatella copri]